MNKLIGKPYIDLEATGDMLMEILAVSPDGQATVKPVGRPETWQRPAMGLIGCIAAYELDVATARQMFGADLFAAFAGAEQAESRHLQTCGLCKSDAADLRSSWALINGVVPPTPPRCASYERLSYRKSRLEAEMERRADLPPEQRPPHERPTGAAPVTDDRGA